MSGCSERWLEGLKRGRSFITNGSLLELDVDGHGPGGLVSLAPPRALRLKTAIRIDQPGSFAVRVTSDAKNELGAPLFGHTSAVYFELAGKRIFDPAVAGKLIAHIEEAVRRVEPRYRCRRLTNV